MLGADVVIVAVCPNESALVPTDALVGPVPLEVTSIASELADTVQPPGGVTRNV